MAKKKAYKVRTTRTKPFCFFKRLLKLIIKTPEIINLNEEELDKKAIYVMNHAGARGPLAYELHFPIRSTPWGAHEMCGNYKERWNYLYHIFYQQKLHWKKPKAFIIATLFAIISKYIYNSTGLIGTYTDIRLFGSIKNSLAVLNENISIVIFPEDSTNGYLDKPTAFNKGFITLAKTYFKKTKEDLNVYSVYFNKKQNKFIIDKPMKINKMLQEGKSEDEIADIFLRKCHYLYDTYVLPYQE